MNSACVCFFRALLIPALLLSPASSAPFMYELLLAAPNARLDERIAGLLERNLPEVTLTAILPAERYRKYPHFPVGACSGNEYFLLAHGKRLIAFGCIDDSSAAAELGKIRRALIRERETSAEALYDAALQSAAAGEWPNAREYARRARARGGISKTMVARLQQLLYR